MCNGIWDCPQGNDETIGYICTKSRQCVNLYRCRHASRCVHINDVCNKKIECPLGDDEYFCRLNNVTCPSNCQCLTFVLKCYHNKNVWNTSISQLPYHVIYVKNSTHQFVSDLLNHLTFFSILQINYNSLV